MPTLRTKFESCSQEIRLFDSNIDLNKDYPLSNAIVLKVKVKKSTGDDSYTVGLGLKVQLQPELPPLMDGMMFENFQIPIPGCADFVLPGNGSLRELARSVGNTLSSSTVRYFMKALKLDTVLKEGSCEALTAPKCPWTIDVQKFLSPKFKDKLTCVMTPNCLGVTCCLDVTLKLPLMQQPLLLHVPFSFVFSPCDNMKVRMAVGSFVNEEQLLNYEFGQKRELTIGKGQFEGEQAPLTVTFKVDHYRKVDPNYDEGFLVDLNIRLCVPFDGESICFPDKAGFDVMKKQKVPVCNPASIADLKNFNLTAFLESTRQPLNAKALTRTVALTLLNKFGITDDLQTPGCDLERAPYSPAVDGWRNECPFPTQYLPKLDARKMACHLSAACNRVDCCIHSSFLGISFHAWVELNCDLYLQAGVERLASPKLYVMGDEVDWNQGIKGEVNISEAFRVEYVIRKTQRAFVLDVTVKLCFDGLGGDCQLTVAVMKDTQIPQLGCDPNTVSYFHDLFKWKDKCILPAGDTDCKLSLPKSLNGKCVLTNNCHKIQCCVSMDLGFLGSHSVEASFEFDRCSDAFVYTLERKSGKLSLGAILDNERKLEVGKAITFYYQVSSHPSGYTLTASLKLCALEATSLNVTTCSTYDVIPADVSIYSPSSECAPSGKRRRKRQASTKIDCANSPLSKNELLLHKIEKEDATEEDLRQCVEVFKKNEESRCEKLQKKGAVLQTIFSPKAIMAAMGSQNPSTLLFCGDTSVTTVDIEGGEQIYKALQKVEEIKGRLEEAFTPGRGLTGKGAKALAFKMAGMTIGELQAYVMSEGVDPELAFQLMKDMKDLLYSLYSDIMNSIEENGGEDLFKSFDLSISGDFSVPRQSINFFKYKQFFLVGGIVPMTFKFRADISSQMKVEVGAKVMQMQLYGQLRPAVALTVEGSLSIGALLLGELRLTGYICEVALPSQAAITFSKFPMDLTLTMDMELTPLELKLAALVTLKVNLVFASFRKVLFKTNLLHYKTPTISKRLLSVGQDEPDSSPPEFSQVEDDSSGQRRHATHCEVTQLAGLDYTEPAIELAVSASDDKSQPTLEVSVGTSPSLHDLHNTEMGGPSTIIRKHLGVSAQPVYFTVRATNNAGGKAEVTCSLDTYDVTLPQGRLEADYPSTSNRRVLSGSLVVHEDSPLIQSSLAIGEGKGLYATGTRGWQPVNLKDRSVEAYDAGGDPSGHVALAKHFAGFKEGRLIVAPRLVTRDSRALYAADCAKQCMALSENKCMSFNYHTDGHCELLEAIAGHGRHVAVATNYLHYERLGVGLAHEFTIPLVLRHNSLYFFNLLLENSLNFVHIISSHGTIVDLTPPLPGPINITSDLHETIPCEQNLPKDRRGAGDWGKWCRNVDPTLPNHRILHDGPGSATVFNGHTRMTDLRYTKSNTYISANWDGIHDYESGILGYSITVGRKPCEEWLVLHYDPHAKLVPLDDDSQWTHIAVVNTENGVSLKDGKYYVTLRALNEVKNGGPLSLTICHTAPYSIDTSPPHVYEVYGTKYDEDTHDISTKYNATDPHSDIHQAALCLGHTVLNCGVLSWQRATAENITGGPAKITHLIPDGVTVWVRLRVENGVELQAVGHALHPIIVDRSAPEAGTVYDGPVSRKDLAYSKDKFQYCANWFDFADPQSGISYYMGAVTSSDGEPLTNLTLLERNSHMTCLRFSSPPLVHNSRYRFTLYAFNGGHKQLNVSAESDGVLIDLTAPQTGDVIDGLRPGFADVKYSVHQATVAAQWRGFSDPESGMTLYEVQVERAANLSSDFQTIKPWTKVGLASSFESHDYHLKHRDVVRSVVRATNGALNTASKSTDTFLVDLTPPRLGYLWDGQSAADINFQSDVKQLGASFEFMDEESGVDHIKYQVYQTQHGHRTQIIPPTRNAWAELPKGGPQKSVSVMGLSLTPGLRYYLRVGAVNGAGSVATYDTDGVLVDPTPPVMERVHVGVLSSEEEVVIDGRVLQSDVSGIKASWLATDHESGVKEYQVSVGTTAGNARCLVGGGEGRGGVKEYQVSVGTTTP
ncbi:hypothetical protein ACOMHN_029470 [Nucella lapillus]